MVQGCPFGQGVDLWLQTGPYGVDDQDREVREPIARTILNGFFLINLGQELDFLFFQVPTLLTDETDCLLADRNLPLYYTLPDFIALSEFIALSNFIIILINFLSHLLLVGFLSVSVLEYLHEVFEPTDFHFRRLQDVHPHSPVNPDIPVSFADLFAK